jgi:hypothetical protein
LCFFILMENTDSSVSRLANIMLNDPEYNNLEGITFLGKDLKQDLVKNNPKSQYTEPKVETKPEPKNPETVEEVSQADPIVPEVEQEEVVEEDSTDPVFPEIEQYKSKIAELEEKLTQPLEEAAPPVVVSPSITNPLSNVFDNDALDMKSQQALQALSWCRRNREGGTITQDGKEHDLSAEEVGDIEDRAQAMLISHIPSRKEFIKELKEHETIAREIYPDLFNTKSQEYRDMQTLVKQVPGLLNFPDWRTFAGHFLAGKKLADQKKSSKLADLKIPTKKLLTKSQIAPKPAISSTASKNNNKKDKKGIMDYLFENDGNLDSLMKVLK